MNEKLLDQLVSETFERQDIYEQIEQCVMTDTKRLARRAWIRKWGRLVVAAFGWPIAACLYLLSLHLLTRDMELTPALMVAMGVGIAVILGVMWQFVKNFKVDESL